MDISDMDQRGVPPIDAPEFHDETLRYNSVFVANYDREPQESEAEEDRGWEPTFLATRENRAGATGTLRNLSKAPSIKNSPIHHKST